MQVAANHTESTVAIRTNLGAIFVSLELSRSKWLVTSVNVEVQHSRRRHCSPAGALWGSTA
jgi:transposase